MKKCTLFALLMFSALQLVAEQKEVYSRVRIDLSGHKPIEITALGIEIDHGRVVPHNWPAGVYTYQLIGATWHSKTMQMMIH